MEARGSFGVDPPEELNKLKRRIIATDKLVKKINKMEKTLKTTEDALSEKEKEIVELKSNPFQSLTSPKQKPEQKTEMEKLRKLQVEWLLLSKDQESNQIKLLVILLYFLFHQMMN